MQWYKNSVGKLPVIVQVIIVIILAFALYKGLRWVIRRFKTRGQQLELTDTTTTIQNLQNQGLQPSFPISQYSTWANQLQEAFDGCGTSNGVWQNIFSTVKNDLDVVMIIDAYGVREFDACNWEGDFGNFKGTLSEALIRELSGSEITEINKYLQSKNIKYRF